VLCAATFLKVNMLTVFNFHLGTRLLIETVRIRLLDLCFSYLSLFVYLLRQLIFLKQNVQFGL